MFVKQINACFIGHTNDHNRNNNNSILTKDFTPQLPEKIIFESRK